MKASSLQSLTTLFFATSLSAAGLLACSSNSGSGNGGADASSPGNNNKDGGGGGTTSDAGSGSSGEDAAVDSGFDAGMPCTTATQCGDAATAACCEGHCTDTSLDPRNCGACGTACTATQFCTGTKCDDAIFSNVCDNPRATLVWDAYASDNDAGAEIGTALTACSPSVTVTQQQNESLVTDPATGRPLLGVGNTYLIGGGWYGHPGMAYMDKEKLSPVQVNSDGTTNSWIQNLATGEYVVKILTSTLTATNDYFLIELVVEPESGTLCFAATGMLDAGTAAAGYFTSTQVIPNRSKYPDAWYAYHWQDTDTTAGPSAGDTWTQLGSGM
jgi:hypothetical protein